jgi:Bacterial tandem repeat domain 1
VFVAGSGGHGPWANATWPSFEGKWKEWSGQGLRLVDVNALQVGGETRYSGVFLPGTDGHHLWANVTYERFRAKWQELAEQGLRLVDFEIAQPDGAGLDAGGESADAAFLEDADEFGGVLEGGRADGPADALAGTGDAGGARFFPDGTDGGEDGMGGASFVDGAVEARQMSGHGHAVLSPRAGAASPPAARGRPGRVSPRAAAGLSGRGRRNANRADRVTEQGGLA